VCFSPFAECPLSLPGLPQRRSSRQCLVRLGRRCLPSLPTKTFLCCASFFCPPRRVDLTLEMEGGFDFFSLPPDMTIPSRHPPLQRLAAPGRISLKHLHFSFPLFKLFRSLPRFTTQPCTRFAFEEDEGLRRKY